MSLSKNHTPPTGWGNDPLTGYLDQYRDNQLATFANKRSVVIDLTTIDNLFRKLVDGAVNPDPIYPMNFLGRAHSAFLASAGAAMACQVYESQTLLRVCLEQGAYAFYIGNNTDRWKLWMGRHDSKESKQKVRDEFMYGKIRNYLTDKFPILGKNYSELYDRVIDYGAHPNERGASLSSMSEVIEDGGQRFSAIYLHEDGLALDLCLKTTAQIGILVLLIAQEIYPARFQATGIKYQLKDIAARY